MEFGLFNSLYTPRREYENVDDQWAVEAQRLQNEINWTIAADKAGFKYTWATEHHFLTEYSHLSSNEAFLGYLAGRTERIHLGSGIFNVTPPVAHPARVAEKVAMLDHLSGGRFEFGIGRGSSTTEQRGFGITDPEDTKLMLDEVIPQFKHMWRDERVQLRGQVLLAPAPQRATEAVLGPAPADVDRGRQPGHVREGGPDGPRRALLHHRHARDVEAAHREVQEHDRQGRTRGRVRQRQHHGHEPDALSRGRRRVRTTSRAT